MRIELILTFFFHSSFTFAQGLGEIAGIEVRDVVDVLSCDQCQFSVRKFFSERPPFEESKTPSLSEVAKNICLKSIRSHLCEELGQQILKFSKWLAEEDKIAENICQTQEFCGKGVDEGYLQFLNSTGNYLYAKFPTLSCEECQSHSRLLLTFLNSFEPVAKKRCPTYGLEFREEDQGYFFLDILSAILCPFYEQIKLVLESPMQFCYFLKFCRETVMIGRFQSEL